MAPSSATSVLPPFRRDPRDEDITEEIVPGEEPRIVVRLPPRDRAALVLLSGAGAGAIHPVAGDEVVVGRSPGVGLSVDEHALSRRHARVFRTREGFSVEDLGSTNGTFVNGERVGSPVHLRDGDRIQIGRNVVLRFVLQDALEQQAAQQLYDLAVRDALTGLYNRRYLDDHLAAEHAFALRHTTDLTVMLADVDHFKEVNDTYGHAAGDAVLRVIGKSIRRMLRSEDLIARYGGEELCVVGRALDRRNATIVAERFRKTIASLALPWEGKHLSITVSVGVATLCSGRGYPTPQALLAAADSALYRAKQTGRDRVCAT